jgi:hypothetical protein
MKCRKHPLSGQGEEEKSCQTRVHSFSEAILCGGIGCKVEFVPIRKDQVFCSPSCKSRYFAFVRKLGDALLKAHAVEVNEGEPGDYEVKFDGQILRIKLKLKGRGADKENQDPASFGE